MNKEDWFITGASRGFGALVAKAALAQQRQWAGARRLRANVLRNFSTFGPITAMQ
jgi:NAD(P)-dependent dehydrogenase (short-subunit alcohol dehydrogenase family)